MKNIFEELNRVKKLIECEPDFHIHQKFQIDMEWWVIGHVTQILKEVNERYPTFAKKNTIPDFLTFDDQKNEFNPMEVTEALLPGRKRVEEYKKAKKITDWSTVEGKSIDIIPNPWSTLQECLKKKFNKTYPPQTWLIIYYNISYGHISLYGYWDRTLLANAIKWDMKESPFARILVLDATGKALVELFPNMIAIKPEK